MRGHIHLFALMDTDEKSLGLFAYAERDWKLGDIIPQGSASLRVVDVIEPMPRSSDEIKKQASEYRALADQARRDAEQTRDPGTRNAFLKVARDWLEMAAETEEDRFR